MTVLPTQPAELTASECRACGACCSFSPEWPRFSLESDADLDRIPRVYVDREHGRMRCSGNRCAALVGQVGIATACAIYAVRPDVCRARLLEMTPAKWHGGASIFRGLAVRWANQVRFNLVHQLPPLTRGRDASP